MKRTTPQIAEFTQTLDNAARRICPQYNVDPARCVKDAAKYSGHGRFGLNNNHWGLWGNGDMGHHLHVAGAPDSNQPDGWGSVATPIARFSTLDAGIHAYCQRLAGPNGKPSIGHQLRQSQIEGSTAGPDLDPPKKQESSGGVSDGVLSLTLAAAMVLFVISRA